MFWSDRLAARMQSPATGRIARRALSQYKPHFAVSDHAAGLLVGLRRDLACQHTEFWNFGAMGTRVWHYSERNGEKNWIVRLLHAPWFLEK